MTFCTRCGKQIEDGQVCSCSANQLPKVDTSSAQGFWTSMKNRMGIGDPEKNATDCYERGQRIVPDSIKTNESEIPVKQYNVAVLRTLLKFERAEGRMQVTNKRVVFRAAGRSIAGRTTLQHEFAIDEIAGIEARRDYKFSLLHLLGGFLLTGICVAIVFAALGFLTAKVAALGIILALVVGAVGPIPFFTMKKKWLRKLLACAEGATSFFMVAQIASAYAQIKDNGFVGFLGGLLMFFAVISAILFLIALFLFCFQPNLILSIKNKTGMGEAVNIRRDTMFTKRDEKGTGFAEVRPTEETERAIREIGAMINDIQKLGDFGVEKWTK